MPNSKITAPVRKRKAVPYLDRLSGYCGPNWFDAYGILEHGTVERGQKCPYADLAPDLLNQ